MYNCNEGINGNVSLCESHWKNMRLTFGENRQAIVTLAERLIVTDILVIRRATWFAVPKYNGTKANQITQVVYMVKPKKYNRYENNNQKW